MESNTDKMKAKRRNLGFFLITLLITLAASVIYKYFQPSFMNFLLIGLIAALVNIFLYFVFAFKNKVRTGDEFYDNNMVIIVGGLTLVIPYFIFFAIFSVIFSGFQIPFKLIYLK